MQTAKLLTTEYVQAFQLDWQNLCEAVAEFEPNFVLERGEQAEQSREELQ